VLACSTHRNRAERHPISAPAPTHSGASSEISDHDCAQSQRGTSSSFGRVVHAVISYRLLVGIERSGPTQGDYFKKEKTFLSS
jgi:hypothetical protein